MVLGEHKNDIDLGTDIVTSMDAEFHDTSDRVVAVIGASYLDAVVEALIRAAFLAEEKETEALLGLDRPLGSASSRYQLAYCLCLITKKERDDLKMVARIRNAFAHRYGVTSFEHAEPQKHLAKLHHGEEFKQIVQQLLNEATDEDQRKYLSRIAESGRRLFQDTVRNLFVTLLGKVNRVSRVQPGSWYCSEPNGGKPGAA